MTDVAAAGWTERLQRAVDSIDALNAEDPNLIEDGGVLRPKEVVHAERMTSWLLRLDPEADDVRLVAARAHHLRRWVSPRDTYPEGRAGYLRWRTDAKRRHADEVGPILTAAGYSAEEVERVGRIIRKDGLGRDPEVGTHEDALCLVFFELQLAEVAAKLDPEHAVTVLDRTARKMTPAGRLVARTLAGLPEGVRVVLHAALDDADEAAGESATKSARPS